MYSYKIFRLIVIAVIITYFVGCFWYLISDSLNEKGDPNTFIKRFDLEERSDYDKLIISCYFALVTLSTVGYGDYYPVSQIEMLFGMVIMLCGVAFFSYIMGSFIEIIANYDKKMGTVDHATELHNWITLLTRFTNNKPLPKSLVSQIENHFDHYWDNDRLSVISKSNEFLNALPRSIKRDVSLLPHP